jgi:thiol-disulfide isomerase/thioredoxin
MKKLSMLAFGMIASISVFAQSNLPTTVIKDVNTGKKISFNETIKPGRVTVVSFWATWCVPCKKEINNVRKKMPTWKQETDFDYVTVSVDESRMEGMVRSYVKSQGWDFPAYQDANSDLKRSLNFQNVPFTMIVGKDGKTAWMHTGYEEGGENEMYEMVKIAAAK